MVRFLLPLPPLRRQQETQEQNGTLGPDGLPVQPARRLRCCWQGFVCCPLSHLLVVVANTLQLICMVVFLCLLLACINTPGAISWFSVFSPLWLSDLISALTDGLELIRVNRRTFGPDAHMYAASHPMEGKDPPPSSVLPPHSEFQLPATFSSTHTHTRPHTPPPPPRSRTVPVGTVRSRRSTDSRAQSASPPSNFCSRCDRMTIGPS
jgi:hypothetical protein